MNLLMLTKTSLRARFIIGVSAMLLPQLAIGAAAFYAVSAATDSASAVGQEILGQIEPLTHLQTNMQRAVMPPNDYLIHGRDRERRAFAVLSRRVDDSFKSALLSAFSKKERSLLLAAERRWKRIKPMSREILSTPDPIGNAVLADKMERLDSRADRTVVLLDQAHDLAEQEVAAELRSAGKTKRDAIVFIITALVASFGAALVIATLLARSIVLPVSTLTESARRFAAGDLGYRAPKMADDELGRLSDAFNSMAEKLEANLVDIKSSESRFRAISDTAGEAIISIDSKGKIIFANNAVEKYFGYAIEKLVGRNITALMPERFRETHGRGMNRYLTTGQAHVMGRESEFAGLKKDGTEFPIEISVAAWTSGEKTFFTGIIRDITERKTTEQLLRQMSITDSLTGLYNHAEFYRRLTEELERSRRYGPPVSLLMLDIDHFKEINDEYGHQGGDNVLLILADIIVKTVRPIDKIARYGGEEFTVILPQTDSAGALTTAERLRRRVEERILRVDKNRTVKITVSIGVAECPLDATAEDALVSRADEAMYASKAAGRNRVRTLRKAA